MHGDEFPPGDHVLRWVGDNLLAKDEDGNPRGYIESAALAPRPQDTYLSVQWVEFVPGDADTQILAAIQAFRRGRRKTGSKSAFAKAQVGNVTRRCYAHRPPALVRILHEPEENNSAHAGIHHLPRDDAELLRVLADEAFTELIWNRDIPPE